MIRTLFIGCVIATAAMGCKRESGKSEAKATEKNAGQPAAQGTENGHAHGDAHDHGHPHDDGHAHDDDHAHDSEVDLGQTDIDGMVVKFAQGHGKVIAGKESHLVVKLPYNDNGSTVVRAWLGTEDRSLSLVGRATYAPSHDDYDVHAIAPNPLPDKVMWWVEIQKPDGSKHVGSIKPLM